MLYKETQRLIGVEYDQLKELLQNVERLHHEKPALLESKKERIIAGGRGRKPKLSIPEPIILTLRSPVLSNTTEVCLNSHKLELTSLQNSATLSHSY
ncbi:hypothetical protein [Microcoleus vaginatus]|uniref:hypothetical protein n=1 Tax=Microcoleus vaginatus TaxID=119532 RepID=UPI001F620B60